MNIFRINHAGNAVTGDGFEIRYITKRRFLPFAALTIASASGCSLLDSSGRQASESYLH